MRTGATTLAAILLSTAMMCGCGGGSAGNSLRGSGGNPPAAPTISATAAACGEKDVRERVNAATTPDWNSGSIHGTGFTGGTGLGTLYDFPSGQTAAQWHAYGRIWSKGSLAYYVDDLPSPT